MKNLICFDIRDGKTLWKKTINHGKTEETHKTNPHCAASPVTDGTLVFAWHGNASLAFAGGSIYFRTDSYLYAVE